MAQEALAAQIRTSTGKGAARKLRRNNQVPAIIYGVDPKPLMVAVNYSQLARIVRRSSSDNIMLDLQIESDQGTLNKKVMLKELQVDPIKDTLIHADFYELSMDKEITVEVRINLVGSPVGVTKGGILQHVKRDLSISCLPDKLVDSLDVDVAQLDIGDAIHVKDIQLPEGIRCLDEGDLTIAVVAAPTVSAEEEVAEEEEIEEETAEAEQTAEESEKE